MDIRKKTVKASLRDEEIKKLQEQVLQLHRDKTALMSKCTKFFTRACLLFLQIQDRVFICREEWW